MSTASVTQIAELQGKRVEQAEWNSALILRIALVVAGVLLCYCFQWQWLRYFTSEANLRVDAWFGLEMQRLSSDTVLWKGVLYKYQNACTFADVWCGAIPLIWNASKRVLWNLAFIGIFSIALFAFNTFRLSLSDVFFNAGIPWLWAHQFLGGCAYFAVWLFIWKTRSW
jgi:hypothetical protein